jgi:uncharacterized ferritin-like protein (DUF455 family)
MSSATFFTTVLEILACTNAIEKIRRTREMYANIETLLGSVTAEELAVERAATAAPTFVLVTDVKIVPPSELPPKSKSIVGLLHHLAFVEVVAVDLALDLLVRPFPDVTDPIPLSFYREWARVADDEAKHFDMLTSHLLSIDPTYVFGFLPLQGNLFADAVATASSMVDRLVLLHCVHEARGCDVTSLKTIPRLKGGGDKAGVAMMQIILDDEVTHVEAGLRWFRHLVEGGMEDEAALIAFFHTVVRRNFHGKLKGPFATKLRQSVGMTEEWYIPLSK